MTETLFPFRLHEMLLVLRPLTNDRFVSRKPFSDERTVLDVKDLLRKSATVIVVNRETTSG